MAENNNNNVVNITIVVHGDFVIGNNNALTIIVNPGRGRGAPPPPRPPPVPPAGWGRGRGRGRGAVPLYVPAPGQRDPVVVNKDGAIVVLGDAHDLVLRGRVINAYHGEGACTLLGFMLKNIPLAVLFGIFLYLGVTSMLGVQFLHRLTLILLPQKYYPDYPYCQQVSMWRMHFFSLIQLSCLIVLWLCKNTKSLSLAFPFLLMIVAILRKLVLGRLFDEKELAALDGHDEENQELESDDDFYSDVGLPM